MSSYRVETKTKSCYNKNKGVIKINLNKDERVDDLQLNDLKIIQNKNYFCFGIDSIILSDFAKCIKNNSIVLDLGTGTGIISILLTAKINAKKIYGIELQKEVAKMADKSIKLNKLENKIEIINDNIKNLEKYFKKNSIDAIVTNPPYKKQNTGLKNENKIKLLSKYELESSLEDFIKISSILLKDKGEFYIVHRPDRIADIIEILRKYKLEPKLIKLVYPKINKAPNLILIKSVKNANSFLKFEEPLIVYSNNNMYTKEILEIYNKI